MFCPQCGTETHEVLKFCKQCGVNLRRVQGVLGKGGAGSTQERVDWNRVALEEHEEKRKRKQKKTPEEKRITEIKAGVLTSSIGFGVLIFLKILFDSISGLMDEPEARILRATGFVGLIPLMVGIGLIINGVFVSKWLVKLKQEEDREKSPALFIVPETSPVRQFAEPAPMPVANFSVAEPTTTRLGDRVPISLPRDTN